MPVGGREEPGSSGYRAHAARSLTARLLAAPWKAEAIPAGIVGLLGPVHHRTRTALATRLAALERGNRPPPPGVVTALLTRSPFFRPPAGLAGLVLDTALFAPAPPFAGLSLPALASLGDLCAWLEVMPGQLGSFAGDRGGHGHVTDPAMRHYSTLFLPKRDGTARLFEAPKPRLKAAQRRILHGCAKGFVSGRSRLDGAQVHAGEAVVVTFDLVQFLPSIRRARVQGLFRSLGYPWAVAQALAGLCSTVTPPDVLAALDGPDARDRHRARHLPQGAPTSPALANLVAWMLYGLARAAGANYTRYADDLAFSGDTAFAGRLDRFGASVAAIAREEGFVLNAAKTRVMRRHVRQQVTGIVVNAHCNVGRTEFDALKATLHNCVLQGPVVQNRAEVPDFRRHLDGRVVWVERVNWPREAKLRAIFDRIDWPSAS